MRDLLKRLFKRSDAHGERGAAAHTAVSASAATYQQAFASANAARTIVGLDPLVSPPELATPAAAQIRDQVDAVLVQAFSQVPIARGQCVITSCILTDALEHAGYHPRLTIGFIDTPRGRLWEFSHEDLKRWHGGDTPPSTAVPIHAWVTLPDMTIIDASIVPAIWSVAPHESFEHAVIVDHPDVWSSGFRYHPMILGKDALPAILPSNPLCEIILGWPGAA